MKKLLLIPIILILFCFVAYADTEVIALNITSYNYAWNNQLVSFPESKGLGLYYIDDNYYISYLNSNVFTGAQHLNNWIGTSLDDGTSWNNTQLTNYASTQNPCALFLDIDFDLVCIRFYGLSGYDAIYRYYVKEAEEDYFDTTDNILTISNSYVKDYGQYNYIHTRNTYLYFATIYRAGSIYYDTRRNNGKIDLDIGAYTIDYSNVGTGEFADRTFDYSFLELEDETEVASGYYDRHEWTSNTTHLNWKFYDYTYNGTLITTTSETHYPYAPNNQFLWGYANWDSDAVSIFFIENSTGNLKFINYVNEAESSVADISLNSTIERSNNVPLLSMAEGNNYIWGVYGTTGGDLRLFQLDKSDNFSLAYDELINENGNVSIISNIAGRSKSKSQSSNILTTDDLSIAYVEGLGYPKKIFFYKNSVFDAYSSTSTEPSLSCITDYDCETKFDTSFECVEGVCTQIGAGSSDSAYVEGDFAYEFNALLEEWGADSTSSKLFFAILIIIILDVITAGIMLGITQGQMNFGALSGIILIITILGMFLSVYMGLIPIWVAVLIMMIGAGVVFSFVKGGTH